MLLQPRKIVFGTILPSSRVKDDSTILETLSSCAGHGTMTLEEVDNMDMFDAFSGRSIASSITKDASSNTPTWWQTKVSKQR